MMASVAEVRSMTGVSVDSSKDESIAGLHRERRKAESTFAKGEAREGNERDTHGPRVDSRSGWLRFRVWSSSLLPFLMPRSDS